MKTKAIIYLHGFNSASLDEQGNLLVAKEKLKILQEFCQRKDIVLKTPNVDYRDFMDVVEDMLFLWNQQLDEGCEVIFAGSSLGGFTSEYLGIKTNSPVIMINPAIKPSKLLTQFIGVTENFENGLPYNWNQSHCEQYRQYEAAIEKSRSRINRLVLLDKGDELIDAKETCEKYKDKANVVCFDGGSHGFEHMREALPVIEEFVFSD